MGVSTIEGKLKKFLSESLVYEMISGKPIYRRDYEKVLKGEKTAEEIMGSSELQAILTALIVGFLYSELDKEKYLIATNELGFKVAPKSWYSLDIAIFDRKKLKTLRKEYTDIPPKVVIEIDVKVDLRQFSNPQSYFHRKIQDLLDSGVEKVVWIFTDEKKVWIAERGKPWLITDWDYEIEIAKGVKFNLQKLLSGFEIS